jgi:hypothetical protein
MAAGQLVADVEMRRIKAWEIQYGDSSLDAWDALDRITCAIEDGFEHYEDGMYHDSANSFHAAMADSLRLADELRGLANLLLEQPVREPLEGKRGKGSHARKAR